MKPLVYLAGQPNEYAEDWKEKFKKLKEFRFYDFEFDSDQSSPDLFFPQDLEAVKKADYLVANPGVAPSEAMWIEVGYFYALNVKNSGDFCDKLIIIWSEKRQKWSIEFVEKAGYIVKNVDEAIKKLKRQEYGPL